MPVSVSCRVGFREEPYTPRIPHEFAWERLGWVCGVVGCVALLVTAGAAAEAHAGTPQEAMVVVAPLKFHKALDDYLRFRSARRPTRLVALETVLKETDGVDDPERLKRWLFQQWKEHGVGYVLLVGDADVVPVRYMVLDRVTPPAFDYAFYPSDLYYADVAHRDGIFDDWNACKVGFHAGYFGEVRGEKNKRDPINFDAIDYRPELAVGRWPVDSADEVRTVAAKTIAFEQGVRHETALGGHRVALVWVPGWVDARGRMDGWALRLQPAWEVVKLFGGPGAKAASDEKSVVDLLNAGAAVVFHVGHGFDEGWAESLGVGALSKLTNADRLPVILSAGCSTARFATLPPYEPYEDIHGETHKGTNFGEVFDAAPPPPSPYARGRYNLTGLGERLVRGGPHGAVAYIGCNTGGQPCALTLLDGFARALAAAPDPTLGACWVRAVDHYYEAEHLATITPTPDWYPASIFFQAMKYMVFGDPAVPLR